MDSASLLINLTPADQQPTLLKFIKTRLSGKARQAICDEVGQDCAALVQKVAEKCKGHKTPENIIAKMRSCKQKDSIESFCKQIESLTDNLIELYIDFKVPSEVATSMATKPGVETLIAGVSNAETRTILKANFTTRGQRRFFNNNYNEK